MKSNSTERNIYRKSQALPSFHEKKQTRPGMPSHDQTFGFTPKKPRTDEKREGTELNLLSS